MISIIEIIAIMRKVTISSRRQRGGDSGEKLKGDTEEVRGSDRRKK
jgi:hypothetical protein